MGEAHFSWIDLSTFDVGAASKFYQQVFSWEYSEDASGYTHSSLKGNPCAGLYPMPEFFQKINMPSFWMTYISVPNLQAVIHKAQELGGKIELEAENALGQVALIRDPAGAGFTCYEGAAESVSRNFETTGSWCWTELMVSDITLVRDFYTGLFLWKIEEEAADRYAIYTNSGSHIGSIQVASEEVKGTKEFWAVYFAVKHLDQTMQSIQQAGGRNEGTFAHPLGTQALAYDDQGAAFFMIETDPSTIRQSSPQASSNPLKWRSLVGLILIYLIILFDQPWGWGVLFLLWVLPDLKSGTTYFIEPLSRKSNPWLYWAVVLTWLTLSAYMLLTNSA